MPGKVILMGEHAAVYRRPALVAAISRRLSVEMTTRDRGGVVCDLPQVGVHEEIGWDAIRRYAEACGQRWRAYRERPAPDSFRRLRGDDPAHLVKVALGEAAAFVGDDGPPLALRVESGIPIGSGCGSSAAIAVAVVAAYLGLRGVAVTPAELHRLSLEVERRQHGLPSGVDNATVIHGGIVWAEPDSSGRLVATPLAGRSPALDRLRLFHSGPPAESTGDVVAAVRSRKEADPERFEVLFDRIAAATVGLRRELGQGREEPARLIALVRECEACLEALGVVPELPQLAVREVEARGGAAKVSGAGALSGRGAGSFVVYHPAVSEIAGALAGHGWEALELSLGAPGVRQEAG